MTETLTVPVATLEQATDSALATHEVLDEAAHQQIATEVDEDYVWLTERLDATNRELAALREQMTSLFSSRTAEMLSAFQESREQSRTLIEAQTQMIESLSTNLSNLSQSALLTLTPPNSESLSLPEQQPEAAITVTEVVPADSAATAESSAAERAEKKRRRI